MTETGERETKDDHGQGSVDWDQGDAGSVHARRLQQTTLAKVQLQEDILNRTQYD